MWAAGVDTKQHLKARVFSRRSHQVILTNFYVVHAQATGRHMVRSERNIRLAIGAKVRATELDLDLSQDAYASAVLCNSSVLCKPVSILKSTLCEGAWLSNQTQHAYASGSDHWRLGSRGSQARPVGPIHAWHSLWDASETKTRANFTHHLCH